jgi:cation diffusion facilitator CzcD-associated flavoprotein CzcO
VRAAIVGGGIGGLAAAVALRRSGVETAVFGTARTSPIVWRSRQFGQLASASHRWTCALRDGLTARTPARVQTRQQSQILDYQLPEL